MRVSQNLNKWRLSIFIKDRVASTCVFDISLERRNLNIFQVENSKLLQISFLQLCIDLQLKIE